MKIFWINENMINSVNPEAAVAAMTEIKGDKTFEAFARRLFSIPDDIEIIAEETDEIHNQLIDIYYITLEETSETADSNDEYEDDVLEWLDTVCPEV